MIALDARKENLELVLGRTWLSRYEAGRLEPGMVLLSDAIAGQGQELCFAGERIADAEVMVTDRDGGRMALGAWIESLERRNPSGPEPERGSELTELLPARIVLARGSSSLEGLEGLVRGSAIDFCVETGKAADAVLIVAETEAARGKAVVLGEYMGMRITEVLAASSADCPFRTSGKILQGPASAKAKDYDFSRPDCFTRAQIMALELLHRDFLSSFALISGIETDTWKLSVDQLNFTEFANSLAEGEYVSVAPCGSARPRRPAASDDGPSPVEFLCLGERPLFPEQLVREWVRHGWTKPSGGAVLATGRFAREEGSALFNALRDAWKNYGALAPVPAGSLERPSGERPALAFSEWADEYEMVALASIDTGTGEWLNIAYPLRAIESVLGALTP